MSTVKPPSPPFTLIIGWQGEALRATIFAGDCYEEARRLSQQENESLLCHSVAGDIEILRRETLLSLIGDTIQALLEWRDDRLEQP